MKPKAAANSTEQTASRGVRLPGAAQQVGVPDAATEPRELFRFLRYFSTASLVLIAAAALLLALLFRNVAIREIVKVGEAHNIVLTEAAIASVKDDLVEFLDKTGGMPPEALREIALPPELEREFGALLQISGVSRLKIYNREGIVVYSSRRAFIGRNQSDNVGVVSALAGQVASKLIYRDTFNVFDQQGEDDNLIQTYVPIHPSTGGPAQGVFELYVDVDPIVRDSERAEMQVIAGALAIMTLLYAALIWVVRYAERIIRAQHDAIRERSASLEMLSARMLRAQEEEKRKIAFELHEGVAQTLAAVKLSVEGTLDALRRRGQDGATLEPAVQVVKDTINEVRTVALQLRPSSLDDLGLLATLDWYCREFSRLHPQVSAEAVVDLQEQDVPEPLKIIIYRVIEDICQAVASLAGPGRLRFHLERDGERIVLTAEHDLAGGAGPALAEPVLAAASERILLSGGSFEALGGARNSSNRLRASWLR
jgi:signal transduction histidine kinase